MTGHPSPTRRTQQRELVASAMANSTQFRSAQQVHAELRQAGATIGLATVYRILQLLARAAKVDVILDPTGQARYRRCENTRHHHHLICRECGGTVEVEGPTAELWAQQVAVTHGFSEVAHTIELTGLCPACH